MSSDIFKMLSKIDLAGIVEHTCYYGFSARDVYNRKIVVCCLQTMQNSSYFLKFIDLDIDELHICLEKNTKILL